MKSLIAFIMPSWWVFAFMLLCCIVYERGLQQRDSLFNQLTEQKIYLIKQKESALKRKASLELEINSQSDLAWVELTLMKGLGVVPEGQTKVFFKSD